MENNMVDSVYVALTSIVAGGASGFLTGCLGVVFQERKLRRDYKLEFMAENAAGKLLESKEWRMRSFTAIKARLGGFEDDELRKVLVSGADAQRLGRGRGPCHRA
jgi:hypothetical protein